MYKARMSQQKLERYVPLAVWLVIIGALLLTVGKIIGYGFLPPDDALRHAAKAVSGKPWSDILVMRSGFEMDPYPGWHAILGAVHHFLGYNTETLVIFSVAALMLFYNVATLAWFRRPEAWLSALMIAAVFNPDFIPRMFLGRPYIFTMTVSMALLLLWSRLDQTAPRCLELSVTVLSIAAVSWIHGSFYQMILPAMGLLLAGRWRHALQFGLCWAAGSFLGASFTGHPFLFLSQGVRFVSGLLGDYVLSRQLVTEYMPSDGNAGVVLAVVAMILWRARSPDWKPRDLIHPLFMTGLLGWVLGLKVVRFWADWGMPAVLLWFALEFQKQFERYVTFDSGKRLLLTAGIALAFMLGIGSDRDNRWTSALNRQYLTRDNPGLAGWLPGNDGIIYTADMTVFYNTFFKNPTAPWKYIIGYEPALMRPEDLAVVHKVQWNYGDVRAYEPWVRKMRPEDRLIISVSWLPGGGPPNIPGLEWKFFLDNYWIGRLPQIPVNTGDTH
jgi:hypothetical protein